MSENIISLIDDFIDVVYTGDFKLVNRMSSDLLNFFLSVDNDDCSRFVFILEEIGDELNLENKLKLKELKLRRIRISNLANNIAIPKECDKIDDFGPIFIENLTPEELSVRMNNCTVSPSELPRVPGETYSLINRDNDREYFADYSVDGDGRLTETITKWVKGNPEEVSGLNSKFLETLGV